jgi:hypothetical protein
MKDEFERIYNLAVAACFKIHSGNSPRKTEGNNENVGSEYSVAKPRF